jgi:hypothetical protein
VWKRVVDPNTGEWSRPDLINSPDSMWYQENRFIRQFEIPSQSGSSIYIRSFYEGVQNKFGYFDAHGKTYKFEDRQPIVRAWTDLSTEEKIGYG